MQRYVRTTRTPAALAAACIVALGSVSSHAQDRHRAADRPSPPTAAIGACTAEIATSEQGLGAARDCITEAVVGGLLAGAVALGNQQGKGVFGEQFHIEARMNRAETRTGLGGALDAIIPLNLFESTSGRANSKALFLQNGLTRWTDEQGARRTDIRHGVVHRLAMSDALDAGIVGASVFFEENLERGHQRMVTTVDYASGRGSGWVSYFVPTTQWRAGRPGYEERAAEGAELGVRMNATRTISLDAAAGRWETWNSSRDWVTRTRVGIGWRPHPWVELRGSWEDAGSREDSGAISAAVTIPFGSGDQPRPRWQGLGLARSGLEQEPEVAPGPNMWRAVTNLGRLNVTERSEQVSAAPGPGVGSTEPAGTPGSGQVVIDMSGTFGGDGT